MIFTSSRPLELNRLRIPRWTIFLLAALCFPFPTHARETVTLASDLWCPYTCESSLKPGYAVEILQEIFNGQNMDFKYLIMDWEKAVDKARAGSFHMVAATARNEAPGFVFGHKPIGIAKGAFFTARSSSWRYTGLSSLRGIRLGVVGGYSYGWVVDGILKRADELGLHVHYAQGDSPLLDNLKLLSRGGLDAVVGTTDVVTYTASQHALWDKVAPAGDALFRIPVYVAFSPADPNAVRNARAVDQGIEQLRKSGRLDAILHTYGITDWLKSP